MKQNHEGRTTVTDPEKHRDLEKEDRETGVWVSRKACIEMLKEFDALREALNLRPAKIKH